MQISLPPTPGSGQGWEPPPRFEEYRLIRTLGRGGMGQVYLAHDTVLERLVAVKFISAPGPAALGRVLNEARAAARVQHPNVVTIHRVGQLGPRAYLVSEYTRGTSLQRLPKPIPWRQALKIAVALARGLAAAHRRGVLHLDIKPANAILAETGEVKLLDFGMARFTGAGGEPRAPGAPPGLDEEGLDSPSPTPPDSSGALLGTPHYMSPEAWRGEELTPRSDLYALGVLLYELCAGHSPFSKLALHELPQAAQRRRPVPLVQTAPGVSPAFAAAVDFCLEVDPFERFPSAEALLDVLEGLEAEGASVPLPEGNPYRGLRPFEAEHRALFFGRQRELRAALERLRAESFLLFTGDSGVGKSSLCAAGLLPAVQEGGLGDRRSWELLRLVPGRRPWAALAASVAPLLGEDEARLRAQVETDPEALARRLRVRLGDAAGLLVYVDQLEELVTLAAPEEALRFAEVLAPLAQGLSGIRLVSTARSDFLTRLSALPHLGEALARALCLVRPLGPGEMREAVVGPARAMGVAFESEALVKGLVDSAVGAGGGLPLLQFALAQLWEARDVQHGVITATSLTALGGVAGALARHADGVIESLPPEQRVAARILLLRLVTGDGTRARRTGDELVGGDPRSRAALEALVRGRLLVAREMEDGDAFEVAHEALLGGWGMLARWIAEEAGTRELRQRVEVAAREWERAGQPRDALWGRRLVAEAAALDEESVSAREKRFLAASRLALRRARSRRRLFAVGFGLALAAVAGAVRLKAGLERDRAVSSRLGEARGLLREAEARARAEEATREASFRAFDAGALTEGEGAWARALAEGREVDQRYASAEEALEVALALSPSRQDVREALADVLLAQAERAERAGQGPLREVLARRLRRVDGAGARWGRWSALAALELEVPAGARLSVERYAERAGGALELEPAAEAAEGPRRLELAAGSYLLTFRAPQLEPVRLPVLLGRGEQRRLRIRLPAPGEVPAGFVYVPEGSFLYGTAADETIRHFLTAAPLHPGRTGAFLISRTETTLADWLSFLEALPPGERVRRTPRDGSPTANGALRLRRSAEGRWELELQPATRLLRAKEGERLRYPGRKERAEVDWRRLPVAGVTYEDALAYVAWLSRTGRVPGARLCSEREWERAARGADARRFPHGDALAPDDANFDLTYGKEPLGFGPDEVGAHPASASPFGVLDLAGNVWEWTRSEQAAGPPVTRGGSYYYAENACWVSNRELPEPTLRDPTVGVRVCADAP